MTDLLLFGAGGLAREVLAAVHAINEVSPTWSVLAVIDDDRTRHGAMVGGVPVGGRELLARHPDASVTLCTGSPRDLTSRTRLVTELGVEPGRWATIIHPSASLGTAVRVGAGSILLPQVVGTADVSVGAHVVVMPHCVLTHDDRLGDGAILASGVRLGGGVVVGDGAYLGAGALVREGVRIGPTALIGMGAVVVSDVPSGEVWIGNPARRLR